VTIITTVNTKMVNNNILLLIIIMDNLYGVVIMLTALREFTRFTR